MINLLLTLQLAASVGTAVAPANAVMNNAIVQNDRADADPVKLASLVDHEDDSEQDSWAAFDYYFSYQLDENLHPEVEDEMVLIWILAAIAPLGALWAPYLISDPHDGYFMDYVFGANVTLTSIQLPAIIMMMTVIGIPCGYIWLIGATMAYAFYLGPVSILNQLSRSLHRRDRGEPHPLAERKLNKSTARKGRGERRRPAREPAPEPAPAAEPPPPAMDEPAAATDDGMTPADGGAAPEMLF